MNSDLAMAYCVTVRLAAYYMTDLLQRGINDNMSNVFSGAKRQVILA